MGATFATKAGLQLLKLANVLVREGVAPGAAPGPGGMAGSR
jgi:hypothetical protein